MSAENRQKAQQVMSSSPVISRTTVLLYLERWQRRASQSSLKVAEKKGGVVPNSVDQAPPLDEALGLLPLHFVAKKWHREYLSSAIAKGICEEKEGTRCET